MSLGRSHLSDERRGSYRLADWWRSRSYIDGRRGWVTRLLEGLSSSMRVRSQWMLHCWVLMLRVGRDRWDHEV